MHTAQPDYRRAKKEAEKLLQELRLLRPPIMAVDVARHCGLDVRCCELREEYRGKISGFIDAAKKTIFVNDEDPPQRRKFTVAHELGHFLLGHLENPEYDVLYRKPLVEQNEKCLEQEANCFAANLLVPSHMLTGYVEQYPLVADEQLAEIFGVSGEVITFRKKTLQKGFL